MLGARPSLELTWFHCPTFQRSQRRAGPRRNQDSCPLLPHFASDHQPRHRKKTFGKPESWPWQTIDAFRIAGRAKVPAAQPANGCVRQSPVSFACHLALRRGLASCLRERTPERRGARVDIVCPAFSSSCRHLQSTRCGLSILEAVNVRALFLSDVHLGTVSCQAESLLGFLGQYRADQIYLVGDIIDGWRLGSRWHWPHSHDVVIAALIARARAGARVRYLPGNHDAFLRAWLGVSFVGVEVVEKAIHEAADGQRYLVLHGDQFDLVAKRARWLAVVGDAAYRMALHGNSMLDRRHSKHRQLCRSSSGWAKLKVREIVNFISRYEHLIVAEATRHDVQGVICGHTHQASMHDEFGIRYINTGDWVESCTAVVEHWDGRFEIVRMNKARNGEAQRHDGSGVRPLPT